MLLIKVFLWQDIWIEIHNKLLLEIICQNCLYLPTFCTITDKVYSMFSDDPNLVLGDKSFKNLTSFDDAVDLYGSEVKNISFCLSNCSIWSIYWAQMSSSIIASVSDISTLLEPSHKWPTFGLYVYLKNILMHLKMFSCKSLLFKRTAFFYLLRVSVTPSSQKFRN